ncbi:MAG: MFS transporter [Oscillospiraceae bacterium]
MASLRSLGQRLRAHPLIDLLYNIKGNPRTCVFIEPLWGIPNSLIAPFSAVYMRAMGVSDIEIGFALSAAMVAQVFCAFFGGIIADKLGRKATTILGDFFGWVIPCAIWAGAQNYWFFLLAMVLNSFEQVNQTAWVCLLVEDAEPKHILGMWNWIMIAGQLAVFFSPLSGYLINNYSLVPVMRVLYAMFSIFMLIKCFITIRGTTETAQGKVRMREAKGIGVGEMVKGYWKLIPKMLRNSGTVRVLVIMVVLHITSIISGNFYSLYATGGLGIPESYLAYFPIIRAVIMLLFFFIIDHNLNKYRVKIPMSAGLILYIACQLLVVFSPKNTVVPLIFYTIFEAIAHAMVFPRKELMTAFFVDKQERARIVALLTTFMILFASPFGGISGVLSKADGRLPFVLNIVLFLLAFVVIVTMKQNPGPEDEDGGEEALAEGEALSAVGSSE